MVVTLQLSHRRRARLWAVDFDRSDLLGDYLAQCTGTAVVGKCPSVRDDGFNGDGGEEDCGRWRDFWTDGVVTFACARRT